MLPSSFLDWLSRFALPVSGGLQFFGILIIAYIAILWLALIVWVIRDSMERSNNLLFQLGAILLNIFLPILGLVIYLILRPRRTFLEKYQEDLEYRLLEGGSDLCFSCGTPVKDNFVFCPHCGEDLQQACGSCKKHFSRRWQICPWCGKMQNEKLKMKKEEKE